MQYTSVADNPFAVLTAIVAPAILTNASSVLALGTSNRLARVVDRTRVVAAELAGLEPASEGYQIYSAQLEPLQVRAQMLLRRCGFSTLELGYSRRRHWFSSAAPSPRITTRDSFLNSPLRWRSCPAHSQSLGWRLGAC